MFGGTDARPDGSGSDESFEVPEELDPMDADTDGVGDDLDDTDDVDGAGEGWAREAHVQPAEGDDAGAEVPYEPVDTTPEVPTPPVTGDEAVDEAMMVLAQSQAGSFAERIESGEHAHRSLQSRLGGLGGA